MVRGGGCCETCDLECWEVGGLGMGCIHWYFTYDIISVGGKIQDVTMAVGRLDKREEMMKDYRRPKC